MTKVVPFCYLYNCLFVNNDDDKKKEYDEDLKFSFLSQKENKEEKYFIQTTNKENLPYL